MVGRTLPVREKTAEKTASSPSLSQGGRRKPTGSRRHLPWVRWEVLRESREPPPPSSRTNLPHSRCS